jgi:transcription initiation factor TFIIIB Brf1 subunit/transcription initiation factor TFIIB
LVVPYKCPNCGGTIKIDKDYNQGMKLCAYCGSPIDTTLIASLLGNL